MRLATDKCCTHGHSLLAPCGLALVGLLEVGHQRLHRLVHDVGIGVAHGLGQERACMQPGRGGRVGRRRRRRRRRRARCDSSRPPGTLQHAPASANTSSSLLKALATRSCIVVRAWALTFQLLCASWSARHSCMASASTCASSAILPAAWSWTACSGVQRISVAGLVQGELILWMLCR